MGDEAFGVDLEALANAEKGVRDAVAELGDMAGWAGSYRAEDGRGLVDGIESQASDIGGQELPKALATFAEKWEWGVRFLVEDGVAAADALSDTRSTYEKAEEGAIDAFQYALHAAFGDPMENSTAWQDKSAGEIGGEFIPDYTPSSVMDAFEGTLEVGEAATGHDFTQDGRVGPQPSKPE